MTIVMVKNVYNQDIVMELEKSCYNFFFKYQACLKT